MRTRGDKISVAFCTALLCWGAVSCSMRAAEENNKPAADPWTNWTRYCQQVGGTYVSPEPGRDSKGLLHSPRCLNALGEDVKFATSPERDNLDVEPVEPTDREWPR